MKTVLQFIAGLLLIVVALYATSTPFTKPDTTESVTLSHPDFGKWLTIVWSGGHTEKPYHPNWTSIITNYKPVVRKLPYDKWEVTFTSELTEGIP